ncbi:MAG TPA: MFS transporter [Thermoflexales bacterium]|nr:MFS transporter [Thermoflexales bacterium]
MDATLSRAEPIQPPRFSVLRSMKLGVFHIGSSFADILGSSLWNYTMANGMAALGGFVATPVTLLLALRQLMVPLTIWAGHLSDTRPIFGLRRIPYIWIGRGMMLLSLPLLPLATGMILGGSAPAGWAIALVSFLAFGVGTQLSGSPFVALVRESAPPERQGMAYAIVQTMLVAAFAFSPIIYARLATAIVPTVNPGESALRQYNLDIFSAATVVGVTIALIAWVVSIAGEERRNAAHSRIANDDYKQFGAVLRDIIGDRRARAFFGLLAVGAMSGFAQDGIFEPSLRQVFGATFSGAAGIVGVWGIGLLLGLVGSIFLTRKWATVEQVKVTAVGLVVASLSLFGLAFAMWTVNAALLIPAVLAFGLGFGIYTAGGSPLLMVMTLDARAGVYLGVWSMAQLLFRGIGVALGGVIFDLASRALGSPASGYALVYFLEAIGFAACLYFLRASDVRAFARTTQAPSTAALTMAD